MEVGSVVYSGQSRLGREGRMTRRRKQLEVHKSRKRIDMQGAKVRRIDRRTITRMSVIDCDRRCKEGRME